MAPCAYQDSTEAYEVRVTAPDGSQLVANVDSTTCADIIPPLPPGVSLGTERATLTITGGSGRFAGATGTGTLDTLMPSVAVRYWISSLHLQVTTPLSDPRRSLASAP